MAEDMCLKQGYFRSPECVTEGSRNNPVRKFFEGVFDPPKKEITGSFSPFGDGRLKYTEHKTTPRQCGLLAKKYGYKEPEIKSPDASGSGICTVKEHKKASFLGSLF